MKVIQLLDKFCFGGGERVAITYNQTIRDIGLDASVLALKDSRKSNDEGIHLVNNYRRYLCFIFGVITSDKEKNSWLICHSIRALAIGILFKLIFFNRVKLCFIQHLAYSSSKLKLISFTQCFLEKVVQITPISEKLLAKHFSKKKIFYFNNYIHSKTYVDNVSVNTQLNDIIAEKGARKVISFVGAVKQGKNAVHLVELAAHLPAGDYLFLVVGDGEELLLAKNRAEELSLENIRFLGYQEQPLQFLELSDYFFFSSYNNYEMMPMAVLEAKTKQCIVFGYDMEVNKYILPSENIFKLEHFDEIAKAILSNTLIFSKNEFDAVYGEKQFKKLLGIIA
ncbi:glycosyltransferase [Thalassotalea marina]|uniref:Glycosyl transferase family 1 domain-containing protein n=1 Tax=Thalassotalea marina TaxID=1673741 RepID=A0A919EHK2_9GAMM|nr:glycosyltransferase [Thalassotalea marina]GHF80948.1 hypothetical protein GCM10017161_05330 [Thalassotalea marina]